MEIKQNVYKLRGPQNGMDLEVPSDHISFSNTGEMSKDHIILKIQAGDYLGAKKLMSEILSFQGTEEENKILQGIKSEIEEYIKSLEPQKQDEIRKAVLGETVPGGQTNPKYVIEKMSKLNNYSQFVGRINEQTAPVNLKSLPFAQLIANFETLVARLASKQKTPDEEQQLNNIRAEINSRKDPSKP